MGLSLSRGLLTATDALQAEKLGGFNSKKSLPGDSISQGGAVVARAGLKT